MHPGLAIIAATAVALGATRPAQARESREARGYAASFRPAHGDYCIRFFSDTLESSRPDVAAPACHSRARWAKRGVFITHRPAGTALATR
ncbi:hypothetical protein LPN01_14300 [Sphingomonas sp. A2-49]|uniref:hypothetical protein n=1 Tax=Sphingomonas sp. A2-49 TaxID=1391375 RepID=UPI0021D23221|nr:hypothetical protein [Sphingomonas sp. A2-49]MCU6455253.1 hypothetical protein [Sphingomonas sp. A2-49]